MPAEVSRPPRCAGRDFPNAAKYTPRGGVVKVVTSRDRDEAEIRIVDTGIGIEREMLERVFDLFVQADLGLDRSDGGMGVGLTLVRTIVDRHGGRVGAKSAGLNHGSEFVVRLPLCTLVVSRVDIGSPGLSGFDLARTVRADPATAAIRLVALTGYGRVEDHRHVIEAGFDDHLVKPLKRQELLAVLGGRARAIWQS